MRKQIEIINELKSFWSVKEFLFEAQFAINRKGNGFFRNIRKTSDKSKIFLPNGNQLTVGVPKELKFEEDKSYLISVFVPNDEIRTKFENDYTILLDTKKSPPKALESAPESFVKSLEREYKSVIGIGLDSLKGAIKRISYDINRKPETFIFELLQNADDYPDKKVGRVVVSFKIVGEYLVFQHNGLPFSANNVRALCSVDAGDKEYDFEKIGYKGIGFKSIFKHSNYVVIHSGGYTFKFDENYHRSKGIDTFWQLIPIWTELSELPEIVQNQVGDNFNVTVIIKPEEGNSQLKSYEETFNTIFRDERVLLFLRHVEHFSFRGATTNIVKRRDADTWVISKLDAVVVPYELQKTINAKIKLDDRIPQKYEDIEKSVLTFATRKIDGKIAATEQAHLYAYLPTDLDFGFPFLLNGDFIPDGGRHYLHADLEWNQFLFREAGKNLLKWIAALWSESNDIGAYDMLPDEKKLVSERPGDEKEILLKCFLDGLSEEMIAIKFIASETNELCTVSEIILDDTGLFSKGVLPNELYYNISNSNKKLPHSQINIKRLNSSYLEIEKFTSEQLLTLLSKAENKEKLKGVIKSLESSKYVEFLSWYNTFCYINSVPNVWLISLPIVLAKDNTFSLSEVLFNSHFIFKNLRLKNIEELLTKIGFELSSVYIDDQNYQYIYGVLLQQDSYLKSDVKLYEHIAAAKDLNKLTAVEKNTLLAFFEGLVDVGPAKYAKALPLFKSKKKEDSLKPLNRLISNTCDGLPTWLNDFVIDADEEKALGATFQAQLLKEKDFLEKLFCNSETYSEIITGINIDNVEEFYEYLLKLNTGKAEDFDIDKTIQWVFIESGLSISKASDVYLPDSFTKLPKNKYDSVKAVIESISDQKMPHFSALQIKAPFALGGNNFQLTAITPKQNSIDVIPVNDFLDWAESNGEKDLLQNLTFSKVDEKITIGKAIGTIAFYTTDLDLIKLIEASIFKAKLTLFPSELYTKERSKIGLLEEASLLKYLLDEGYANIDLANHIQGSNDPKLNLQFLENLVELNINTSKTYISEDDEFRILKIAMQYIVPDKDKLKSFKNKITIDGQPLLERAISEDVYFYDKNVGLKTKLSDILPAYKNRTFPLSEIIEKFDGFDDNKNLVALLKDEGRKPKKILKELNELNPAYYDAAQTLFLSYYQSLYSDEKVLEGKIFFSAVQDVNNEEYVKELHRFLDYCLKEGNYTQFVNQEIITGFNPDLVLAVDEYALEIEQLPGWLKAWKESKFNDEVQAFIPKMGIKNESSPVVQLRKGLLGDATVNMDAARGGITEPDLLVNTFEWLLTKHNDRNYAASLLKPLYERALALSISIKNLPLPLPTDITCKTYQLYKTKENEQYHLIWEGWGNHKSDVWNHLNKAGKIVIDELLQDAFLDELNLIKLSVSSELDTENVLQNLRDCNLSFYKLWPEKDTYIIKIFKGSSLPRKVSYNDEIIRTFYEGFYEKVDNSHILAESIENALPHSIKDHIPEFFDRLNSWKSDFENNRTERKLSPEEEEAIMKLFDGVVPEEFRKNLNLAALASALVYLDGEGYDVFHANKQLIDTHEYAQLAPVYKDGVQYTVMCRSARLGLLYLTKKAWDRLDNQYDPNVMLFADKGYGEFELFRSKQEVLDVNGDNPTDFQVMRIESRANASELDEMLQGKFEDASRLWIIFRLKANEHFDKLFFERPETNNNSMNTIHARTDDTGGY